MDRIAMGNLIESLLGGAAYAGGPLTAVVTRRMPPNTAGRRRRTRKSWFMGITPRSNVGSSKIAAAEDRRYGRWSPVGSACGTKLVSFDGWRVGCGNGTSGGGPGRWVPLPSRVAHPPDLDFAFDSILSLVATSSRDVLPATACFVRRSVDDVAAFVRADRREPLAPCLERLGSLPCPVGHFADDPEWIPGAVGAGRVTRELLVGHVRVVLERPCRLNGV